MIENFEKKIWSELLRSLSVHYRQPSSEIPVLLAAVSGGADSTAMCLALKKICKNDEFELHVLHVNHNLRGEESFLDADFVERLCETYYIPLTITEIPVDAIEKLAKEAGCGIEAAARQLRQQALSVEAARINADFVITAHTQNDVLETILMRILRGSGPRGLAGIAASSTLWHTTQSQDEAKKTVHVLRPMLQITRSEVESYLNERGISWQTDSTNNTDIYLRNKIRHQLCPFLDEHFPKWRVSLLQMAETQGFVADFIEFAADLSIKEASNKGKYDISADSFWQLPQIIREEVLFTAINHIKESQNVKNTSKTAEIFDADPQKREKSPPKRETLREFCKGSVKSSDIGSAGLRQKGNLICVEPITNDSEHGFSLHLEEGQKYKIGGLSIECVSAKDGELRIVVVNN